MIILLINPYLSNIIKYIKYTFISFITLSIFPNHQYTLLADGRFLALYLRRMKAVQELQT